LCVLCYEVQLFGGCLDFGSDEVLGSFFFFLI